MLAYYTGGALDERTLSDNRAAFERRSILPRVMTDVSAELELSMALAGTGLLADLTPDLIRSR